MKKGKRFLAFFLVALMIMLSVPLIGNAAVTITISSASDLNKIRNNLSGKYILTQNIDMSSYGNWMPIGSISAPFTGTINGNGYQIKNLRIRVSQDVTKGDVPINAAFIAVVSGGTIINLGITNATISNNLIGSDTDEWTFCHAAGFAGELLNGGLIEKCYFNGSVSAETTNNSFARSSAFACCDSSTIRNCYANASLSAKADQKNTMVGGIAAWDESSTIDKCYARGSIYAQNTNSYVYCGGIVGSGDGTVSNCVALLDSVTVEGETGITDVICPFSALSNNCALSSLTSVLPNRSASAITRSAASQQNTYESIGWNFSNDWTMGTYPILKTIYRYNLREETYSFENFHGKYTDQYGRVHASQCYDPDCTNRGHCFGMSSTSSMYYLGLLNPSSIGISSSDKLYTVSSNDTVKEPICYYQRIQGPGAEYQSIVAGGNMDLNKIKDTTGDWNACVDYVKDHSFDNSGSLTVGMWYNEGGGHAVNFLYYAEVDGQERIYVYDNNFPDDETYYYLESDGLIYQAPLQTAEKGIVGLDLMDVASFFSLATEFQRQRFVYANKDAIAIDGAEMYYMKCGLGQSNQVMYELSDELTQVRITPQKDNATFTYLDQTYSFGAIDDDTYGVLTLSATEDGIGTFVIENAPETQSDPEPDNFCLWCGGQHIGFFQKIIGFLHNIFAKLFGARY